MSKIKIMKRFAIAVMAATTVQGYAGPAWSADLFNGNTTYAEGGQAPRNVPFVVSARYCEDMACEPVTLRIWSGDTFIMDRLGRHHEIITIANIEAPSVHAKCKVEADAAQSAKRRLMVLLEGRTYVLARVVGRKDARSLAFVTVAGRDVGKAMMDHKSARSFETSPGPWC